MKLLTALEYKKDNFTITTYTGKDLDVSETGHSYQTLSKFCEKFFGNGTEVTVNALTLDNGLQLLVFGPVK